MEDADSDSEEYKTAEIYSLTEGSRRLGRRALELAALDESHDPEGVEELRTMAGRHRRDLRRAGRALGGRLTLTERRAFRMLMAAARGQGDALDPINDEDRALYAQLEALFDMTDFDVWAFLKAKEPRLEGVEQRCCASVETGETPPDADETFLALRSATAELLGPESSATEPLLRTAEVEQLAIYTLRTRVGIEAPLEEPDLPIADDPFSL